MKKLLLSSLVALSMALTVNAQGYEVIAEGSSRILKGVISKDLLLADSGYTWYASNAKGYIPSAEIISSFQKQKDSVQFLVFMGTWCGDSHHIIPKFFTLVETAGVSQNRITLIGVDRQKRTHSNLTDALNVTRVPTIIVLKYGKEMGRVVEYGKYGMFDKELAGILDGMN
jgi:thiol-disulfide isomerase/thioredoxin